MDLLAGGGSLLLGSRGNFIGPGYAGFVSRDGAYWFSCHFYDGTREGLPTLALLPLRWNTNGWPEVVQERTPLRTGLAPCTKVYLAGGLRTRSLSTILPPVLVLARDLAVTAVDIDDGAFPARLWNGADFHVVLGTRLLRRWPTRPQLGECLSHRGVGKRGARAQASAHTDGAAQNLS